MNNNIETQKISESAESIDYEMQSEPKAIRKLLGKVCVDSGKLMIVDPCYLEDNELPDSDKIREVSTMNYDKDQLFTLLNFKNGEEGLALLFDTHGDSCFEVYGYFELQSDNTYYYLRRVEIELPGINVLQELLNEKKKGIKK